MQRETAAINDFLDEISYLKKRSALLDKILSFYDKDTVSFNVSDNWKNVNRMSDEILKTIPKTPRHALNRDISELLPYSEAENLVNWDELNKNYL
jgi:hypothetical protein